MKTYEYILFDWDGCLGKTLDVCLDAYKKVFAEYSIYPEDKIITHEVFGDWDGPKRLGITDIDTFIKRWEQLINERYPYVELYEGVSNTLLALKKRKKKLALVTTSRIAIVRPALENNKLMQVFDSILAKEDVSRHKPDPEVIEKALARLGGKKEQAIIIGDSKSDLGAAQNAGIDSLLFYPQHNYRFYDLSVLQSYKPTYMVKDFDKILEIIR